MILFNRYYLNAKYDQMIWIDQWSGNLSVEVNCSWAHFYILLTWVHSYPYIPTLHVIRLALFCGFLEPFLYKSWSVIVRTAERIQNPFTGVCTRIWWAYFYDWVFGFTMVMISHDILWASIIFTSKPFFHHLMNRRNEFFPILIVGKLCIWLTVYVQTPGLLTLDWVFK